jgi:hypothetical protein
MQAAPQIPRVTSSANVAPLRILTMCQPSETHSNLTCLNRRAESETNHLFHLPDSTLNYTMKAEGIAEQTTIPSSDTFFRQ